MPELPAICANCGTVFRSRDFASGPSDAPACPVCGSPARLFAAGDVFIRHTLEIVLQPDHTLNDLRRYREVVGNLRRDLGDDELNVEAAPERLRHEAPELAKLADVLPKTRSELYAFLGLVLAAITLYVTSRGGGSQEVHIRADEVNVNPDRVINRYVAQENEGSWPTKLRSRRDAVKALVTAYVLLQEVRDEMRKEVFSPLERRDEHENLMKKEREEWFRAWGQESPTTQELHRRAKELRKAEPPRRLSYKQRSEWNKKRYDQIDKVREELDKRQEKLTQGLLKLEEREKKTTKDWDRRALRRARQLADQVQRVSDRLRVSYKWLPEATALKVRLCVQRFMNLTQWYGLYPTDTRDPWVVLPNETNETPDYILPILEPNIPDSLTSEVLGKGDDDFGAIREQIEMFWPAPASPWVLLDRALNLLRREIESVKIG